MAWHVDVTEIGRELAEAEWRLGRFERRAFQSRAVARLLRHRPFHLVLVLRAMALVASFLLALATIAVLLVPIYGSPDTTAALSRLDGGGLPIPLGLALLFGCGLLFALCAHLAAWVFGRAAPLLPDEAREHQRLKSDVDRLRTTLSMNDRASAGVASRGYVGSTAATIPSTYQPGDAATILHQDNMDFPRR